MKFWKMSMFMCCKTNNYYDNKNTSKKIIRQAKFNLKSLTPTTFITFVVFPPTSSFFPLNFSAPTSQPNFKPLETSHLPVSGVPFFPLSPASFEEAFRPSSPLVGHAGDCFFLALGSEVMTGVDNRSVRPGFGMAPLFIFRGGAPRGTGDRLNIPVSEGWHTQANIFFFFGFVLKLLWGQGHDDGGWFAALNGESCLRVALLQ